MGLANFAEKHGEHYVRIESVSRNVKGDIVVLDLTRQEVRTAIKKATNATELFNSGLATQYL